jgi:hypothetical protein
MDYTELGSVVKSGTLTIHFRLARKFSFKNLILAFTTNTGNLKFFSAKVVFEFGIGVYHTLAENARIITDTSNSVNFKSLTNDITKCGGFIGWYHI